MNSPPKRCQKSRACYFRDWLRASPGEAAALSSTRLRQQRRREEGKPFSSAGRGVVPAASVARLSALVPSWRYWDFCWGPSHNAPCWCLSGSSASSSVLPACSIGGVTLSCLGLAFAMWSPSLAAWCSLGGSSEHAGTHTRGHPSALQTSLCRAKAMVKMLFCLAWPGFPCVPKRGCLPREEGEMVGFLSLHTSIAWDIPTMWQDGRSWLPPALPQQEHRHSRPSLPDHRDADRQKYGS